MIVSTVGEDSLIRQVGLKVTIPRLKVWRILEEEANKRHWRAEEVYKALIEQGDDVGLATVYRVLTQFEEVGLVKRLNFEGNHSVFEINQGSHHDHLVCIKCGNVKEFYDETIEQRQKAIVQADNFEMTNHSLNIYGICGCCQQSNHEHTSSS